MAQTSISNGDQGSVVRTALNSMFAELYAYATTVASAIANATSKATPVAADSIGLIDSEASSVLKNLTLANLKLWLFQYRNVVTLTTGRALTSADFGKSIRVNSGSTQTLTMPSVGTANDGAWFKMTQIGAGSVVLARADSDTIGNSTDTSVTCSSRYEPYIIEYIHASTKWTIQTAGDWDTT